MKLCFVALVAATVSASVATAAQAPASGDWVEVSRQANGPVFMDRASIRRNGHVIDVRSRADLSRPLENGTTTMYTTFRLNCRDRTADLLSIHFLNARGETVNNQQVPAEERRVEPIGRASPNEAMAALLCQGR